MEGSPVSRASSTRSPRIPHGVDLLSLPLPHAPTVGGCHTVPFLPLPAAHDDPHFHAILLQPSCGPYPRAPGRGSFFAFLPVVALCPLCCLSPSGFALRPLPLVNQSGNREMKLQRSLMWKNRYTSTLCNIWDGMTKLILPTYMFVVLDLDVDDALFRLVWSWYALFLLNVVNNSWSRVICVQYILSTLPLHNIHFITYFFAIS